MGSTANRPGVVRQSSASSVRRNYAHVVIRGDGQTLSLFAEGTERGALPRPELAQDIPRAAVHFVRRLEK